MNELNNLEELWKEQNTFQESDFLFKNKDESLMDRLVSFQQKTKKESITLSSTMIGTCIVLAFMFMILPGINYMIGFTLIVLGLNLMTITTWKTQLNFREVDFSQQGKFFIKNILDKLKARRKMTTHILPFYAILLILGINIGYLDILKLMELSIVQKAMIHFGLTMIMGFIFVFGSIVYLRKFDRKVSPMIEELEDVLYDWDGEV